VPSNGVALPSLPGHRFTLQDVVAGCSVALLAIPQAMAYAELAGLPSYHGLYAVALPLMAAGLFASSPYLQTGPVATTALLTYGALVPLAQPRTPEFVALAGLLALVVGVARIAVGALGVGWISYLMSKPVLEGFMAGAAVLIVASQLPGALGTLTSAPEEGVLRQALWSAAHPGAWEPAAMAMAAGTVATVVLARRIHPLVPGVLIASVGGLVGSMVFHYGGAVVGEVPTGLPPITVSLPWRQLPSLLLPGVIIALVGFAEASSISRSFASEERERWDPDREFIGQGAANVVAGLTSGLPVGGSFGRSSLNRMAGATSRWSGFVTGAAVLAFLPFADLLGPLPRAILAGIVIAAVLKLLKPEGLLRLWAISRPQAAVGWGTFGLTLLLAPRVEQAVLLGILTAGAVHLWRELRLKVRARRDGDTLHLHPIGVLWFASAPVLDDEILAHLQRDRDVKRLELHMAGLGRVDLTGAMTLAEMLDQLRASGLEVSVDGVPQHAYRVLRGVGAPGVEDPDDPHDPVGPDAGEDPPRDGASGTGR
jgi:SulP family sulfate permease